MRYIALIRGINVGKKNWISMADLKAIFEGFGYTNVKTYINSGNVLFESNDPRGSIQKHLETAISERLNDSIPVVVKKKREIEEICSVVPSDWQNDKEQSTNVAFLLPEIDNAELIKELPVKREFINFIYSKGALVWNIKREFLNKSRITNLVGHRSYQFMTIRNVNTLRKLAGM